MRPIQAPRRRTSPPGPLLLLAAALLVLPAACGGGGSGASSEPGLEIAYASPSPIYRTDAPIPPNVPALSGGTADQWSIAPSLPQGLGIDALSGVISGTPLVPAPRTSYAVTASGPQGRATTSLSIEVLWAEEKSILAKTAFSDDDIRHFLERTHFGFSQPHYDLILSVGLETYVDSMTTFAPNPTLEEDAANRYLKDANDPEGMFPSLADVANYWLFLLLVNPNPFQEVLALHWHDHWATASTVLNESNVYYFVPHVTLLRHQGAGNFRQFAIDISRDWAMLEWLDGVRNQALAPNENYGREFFELFMLGVDNFYTQTDIVEASRAFSGYRSRFDPVTGQSFVQFDPNRHDPNDKTVLGQLIPGQNQTDDYEAMVDVTLNVVDPTSGRTGVARWVVRSLLRRFCYANPPENVINDLAAILESGWAIKPLLTTLFLSEAFYSAPAKEGLVKSPTEQVLGFIKATNLLGDPNQIRRRLTNLGNVPTQPPVVEGWPEGASWYSAQAMIDRANLLEYLIADAKPIQNALGIDPADLLPPGTPTSPEVVDALALRLRVTLSTAEHAACVLYLDTDRLPDGQVISDPFDPTDPTHIDQRVRGLLYILEQHPGAFTR